MPQGAQEMQSQNVPGKAQGQRGELGSLAGLLRWY